ncbi:MAG TPA: GNAT family N-acetyltransferase [Anaerolineae bacterium]|nr:GNAT family N-acetyltransferase [Anaerolineae bacterium]
MQLQPLQLADAARLVEVWNAAGGPDLAITTRFVEFNLRDTPGVIQTGRVAVEDDEAIGFVIASIGPDHPQRPAWIDAIAVTPAQQRQGVGRALLAWAEATLIERGAQYIQLGGSLRPFTPGLPIELGTRAFFEEQGYTGDHHSWDVARRLIDYRPLPVNVEAELRPGQPGDEAALRTFFQREFPDRWSFEYELFLREGGRLSDYMLLITARGVDGFCRMTFEDSERPLERFFMQRLPRPWGQAGPLGVSRDTRGKNYGLAVVDAALRHLQARGVDGCVIDWTSLTDFYAKFGFAPYREYVMLDKVVGDR